jgi:quinol monooxygenase YgiN
VRQFWLGRRERRVASRVRVSLDALWKETLTMIVLHATAVIKQDSRERWLELVDAVTPPSRAEEACSSYALYESVETPNTFTFVEEWTSLEGLHAHFRSPHFTEFFAGLGEVLAEAPEGTIFEVSSTITLDEALAGAGIGA